MGAARPIWAYVGKHPISTCSITQQTKVQSAHACCNATLQKHAAVPWLKEAMTSAHGSAKLGLKFMHCTLNWQGTESAASRVHSHASIGPYQAQ